MNDEQILDVIKSVCGFDGAGVERFRAEALIIGRAVEQASRRAALEEAVRVTAQAQTTSHACDAIRKLAKETNNG